jgi:hypothetical protein
MVEQIIIYKDYGPISKIIGALDSQYDFKDSDVFIICDDDHLLIPSTVFIYSLCYDIYEPDCAAGLEESH